MHPVVPAHLSHPLLAHIHTTHVAELTSLFMMTLLASWLPSATAARNLILAERVGACVLSTYSNTMSQFILLRMFLSALVSLPHDTVLND